jgi:hypothetical protein
VVGPEVPPNLTIPLPGTTARDVRTMLREQLSSLPVDLIERVELMASELVEHAHGAGGAVELRLWLHADTVLVHVAHGLGAAFGTQRPRNWGAEIVAALATRWGVIAEDECHVAWFEAGDVVGRPVGTLHAPAQPTCHSARSARVMVPRPPTARRVRPTRRTRP